MKRVILSALVAAVSTLAVYCAADAIGLGATAAVVAASVAAFGLVTSTGAGFEAAFAVSFVAAATAGFADALVAATAAGVLDTSDVVVAVAAAFPVAAYAIAAEAFKAAKEESVPFGWAMLLYLIEAVGVGLPIFLHLHGGG